MKYAQDFKGEHQFVIFSASGFFCGIHILIEALIKGVVYNSKPNILFGGYTFKYEIPSWTGWILIAFGLLLYIYTTRKIFFRMTERIQNYSIAEKNIEKIKFVVICIVDAALGLAFGLAVLSLRDVRGWFLQYMQWIL